MTFKLHVGRKNTWAFSFSVYKYFQKIPVYLLQLPRLSHFPAVMIHDGSICGFISLLLLSSLKIENIWNVMKVFALFMSTWRQQNPKWRLSCHPKSLDNQTQTLQTQDISVIHKANSSSLSFLWALASLDGANLFFPPKGKSVWFRLRLTAGCSKTPQMVHVANWEFTVTFIYWRGKEMLITVSVRNRKIHLCQVIII